MKIRLTKEFNFEMSHALHNYNGLCKNIHGHSYKLFVTIKGEPLNSIDDPKNGMVMDFGDLKKLINKEIIDVFDHSLVLCSCSSLLSCIDSSMTKIVKLDFQPTCENLLGLFANKIDTQLPERVELVGLRLYETATSYAEWYKEDNQ